MLNNKTLKYLAIASPAIIIIAIGIYIGAYINQHEEKVKNHYALYNKKLLDFMNKQKDEEIQNYMAFKKDNAKLWIDNTLHDLENDYQESKIKIKEDLQEAMDSAISNIKRVKRAKSQKQSIKDIQYILAKLNKELKNVDLFLVNYQGDTLYGSNNQTDIDARTIVLEEVQKVRRRGIGYIVSTIDTVQTKRHILVQDLGFHQLFLGANLYEKGNNLELKNKVLANLKNIILDIDECLLIHEGTRKVYSSVSCSSDDTNKHFIKSEFKPFEWKITYVLDSSRKIIQEKQKLEDFQQQLENKIF